MRENIEILFLLLWIRQQKRNRKREKSKNAR